MANLNAKRYLLGTAAGLLLTAGTVVSVGAQAAPAATPTTGTPYCGVAAGAQRGGAFGTPAAVGELLGTDAAQIAAERQAGKSLAQIAEAKGVTEDKLVTSILADRQAQLDARVKAGTLTEAQAKLMLERMQTQVKTAVERTTVGPMGPAGGAGQGLGMGGQMRGLGGEATGLQQGMGRQMRGGGLGFNR